MNDYDVTYRRRLDDLVRQEGIARRRKRDRFNLAPVRQGWVRGRVARLRQREEACEFGKLLVLEFDLVDDPEQPPIPVIMAGTEFNGRLMDGDVVEMADPAPSVRPITPLQIVHSFSDPANVVVAYYPGRGTPSRRFTTLIGWLAIAGPAVAVAAIMAVLHFALRVF
jgi:hypothetical protein